MPFLGMGDRESVCRIEINPLKDGRHAVVCEEVDDNPGLSISQCWEEVVAKVCQKYELDPRSVVWIEHQQGVVRRPDGILGRWQLVTFKPPQPGQHQGKAEWRNMIRDDWLELGLTPRE